MSNIRIKDLSTEATSLGTDDFIPVDGNTSGTRKISKENLGTTLEIPDVGTAPNETPLNQHLGSLAYQSADSVSVAELQVESTTGTGTTEALTVTDGSSTKFVVQEDGRTGINNSSPGTNANNNADDLVVGNGGEHGITIYSGTGDSGRLFFSDGTGTSTYRGYIRYDHGSNELLFGTNSSQRAVIDSTGRVGIGTASPSVKIHSEDTVTDNSSAEVARIQGTSSAGGTNTSLRFTAASSASNADNRWFGIQAYDHNPTARALALQHNGGKVGIGTASPDQLIHASSSTGASLRLERDSVTIASGESYGAVEWEGQDASGGGAASGVRAKIETEATSTSGAVALKFYTAAGNDVATERWRIDSSGNLVANGTAIDFGSTNTNTGVTVTGSVMSEYESGTWTPSFGCTSGAFTTMNVEILNANYVRIGDLVTFYCFIRTDDVDATGAGGSLIITGLPYSASVSSGHNYSAVNVGYGSAWNNAPAGGYVQSGQSYLYPTKRISSITGNLTEMAPGDLTAGTTANQNQLMITGSYAVL